MSRSQGIRAWLTALLALALIAGSLGVVFARGGAAGGSGSIIDSVLGAVPICHHAAGSADAGSGPNDGAVDHCPLCLLLASMALAALALLGCLASPFSSAASVGRHAVAASLRTEWPPVVSAVARHPSRPDGVVLSTCNGSFVA